MKAWNSKNNGLVKSNSVSMITTSCHDTKNEISIGAASFDDINKALQIKLVLSKEVIKKDSIEIQHHVELFLGDDDLSQTLLPHRPNIDTKIASQRDLHGRDCYRLGLT